jgi:hypothetical protein
MRLHASIVLFVALAATCASAQQPSPTPAPAPATPYVPHESVKVYSPGPDVTAPVMLPLSLPPAYTDKCKKKIDGKAKFELLVDTEGHPRNIDPLDPQPTDLNQLAFILARTDRFKPATHDGQPAVVAVSLEIKIDACLVDFNGTPGVKNYSVEFRSEPVQKFASSPQSPAVAVLAPEADAWELQNGGVFQVYKVGSGAFASKPLSPAAVAQLKRASMQQAQSETSTPASSAPDVPTPPACPATFNDSLATDGIAGKADGALPPKPINHVEAEFSQEARTAFHMLHPEGGELVSVLSLIVDVDGKPRDLCLKTPAGYGLDAKAAKAVLQYRFQPATKDGKPVPVRITIEANFRTYR